MTSVVPPITRAPEAPDVRDPGILDGTCLAGLPTSVAAEILVGARLRAVPAGNAIFPGWDGRAHLGILRSGSARSYVTAADGRQMTTRYSRPGSIMSRRADLSSETVPLRVQAVTDCQVLEIDREILVGLGRVHARVAMALVDELAERLLDVYATVADIAFGTMRQRVARHLLAIADAGGAVCGRVVAAVTQQELADGVGSSREAVGRTLAILREEGLVRTAPGEIEILDARTLRSFLGEWRTEGRRLEPDLTFEAERLLEASPNAIVAVDRGGTVVFANASVERVFGWSAGSLVGRPVEVLIPVQTRFAHAGLRAAFLASPEPRPMGLGRELHGRRADGTEFPLAISLTTIDTRDGGLVIATVVDLSPEPSTAERATSTTPVTA